MTIKYQELTDKEKKQIREDMNEHGNRERAAKENDVSETVIAMVWDR